MKKEIINTTKAPAALGPYSQAIKAGNTIYVSGQIPLIPETMEIISDDVQEQTKQSLENVKAVLEAAGATLNDVVKASVFIKDMNDFAKINEIYASYLKQPYTARETVEVARLPKDAKIEISVVAKRD